MCSHARREREGEERLSKRARGLGRAGGMNKGKRKGKIDKRKKWMEEENARMNEWESMALQKRQKI